jgi:hypothetical protein
MKTHAVSQLSYFSKPRLSSREALLYACFGERVLRQRPVAYTSRVIHTDPRGCLLQGLGPAQKLYFLVRPLQPYSRPVRTIQIWNSGAT